MSGILVDSRTEVRRVYLHDNVRVKFGRQESQFFAVHVADPEQPVSGLTPYYCRVSRYILPGRCDVYSFALIADGRGCHRIMFWEETGTALLTAAQMVFADLGRDRVMGMILAALPNLPPMFRRRLLWLITALAAKGRLQREMRKVCPCP